MACIRYAHLPMARIYLSAIARRVRLVEASANNPQVVDIKCVEDRDGVPLILCVASLSCLSVLLIKMMSALITMYLQKPQWQSDQEWGLVVAYYPSQVSAKRWPGKKDRNPFITGQKYT